MGGPKTSAWYLLVLGLLLTALACGGSSSEEGTPTRTHVTAAASAPATPVPTATLAPTTVPTPLPTPTPLPGEIGQLQLRLKAVESQYGTIQETECIVDESDPNIATCTANLRGIDANWGQILVHAMIGVDEGSPLAQGVPLAQRSGITFVDNAFAADESEFYFQDTPGNEAGPCSLYLNARVGTSRVYITVVPTGNVCPPWDSSQTDAMSALAQAVLG